MSDFVPEPAETPYTLPTVLLVGTSMSAGKTYAGRVAVRQLKALGHTVVGAKLTGAGFAGGAGRQVDVLSCNAGTKPFSEPESRALRDLIAAEAPVAHVDLHSFSQLILYPWGYTYSPPPEPDLSAFIDLSGDISQAIAGVRRTLTLAMGLGNSYRRSVTRDGGECRW